MTTNRFSLIVAAFVIAALAILTISSMAASSGKPEAAKSVSSSYDRIELVRAARYQAAAAQQAYMDQRRGEWTAGHAVQGGRPIGGYRPADDLVGSNSLAPSRPVGGYSPADDFVGTAP